MKSAIQGLFFDFYGTLLVLGDEKEAWKEWGITFYDLVKHKTDLSFEDFSKRCDGMFRNHVWREPGSGLSTYETKLNRHLLSLSIELTREELRRVADETPRIWQRRAVVPPDTREALKRLKDSFKLALISNFDHAPHVRRTLAEFKLDAFFDPILISDEVMVSKPDPRIFKMALDKTNLQPSQALFTGDNPVDDIDGALGAGLMPVHIIRCDSGPMQDYSHAGSREKTVTRPGVRTIRQLTELMGILNVAS